ncbi:MAG: hypothetical protein Q8S00_09015 [Deltaproteobacteria bacterium]|nr:hypothetical protein [Deltaproteobacteria bacterium]MDZ4347423.1 hypothetical protein [Candidatus Binatia bacterium]
MPPVVNPNNLYRETRPEKLSQTVTKHLSHVYVPARKFHEVAVIDPATFKVIDRYPVGRKLKHMVPSWDLKTLWLSGRFDNVDTATGKIKSMPLKTEHLGQTRGTFHYARGAES